MKPIRHPSNTRTLQAPLGWDEALPVDPLGITDQVIEGVPCVWSFWQPDADELAALNAGMPVILSLAGRTMSPAILMVEAPCDGSARQTPTPAQAEAQQRWPQELNDDLIEILGRPNFRCALVAEALRVSGMAIQRKAEHEQAAVLHYLLGFYLQHGSDWWQYASDDLSRRAAALRTRAAALKNGAAV